MNDAILSLLIGSCAGILGLIIRYSYYSKCDEISCCGICKIHRQVVNENNNPENNEISINVKSPTQKEFKEQKSIKL